jgi:hypothetical protein
VHDWRLALAEQTIVFVVFAFFIVEVFLFHSGKGFETPQGFVNTWSSTLPLPLDADDSGRPYCGGTTLYEWEA